MMKAAALKLALLGLTVTATNALGAEAPPPNGRDQWQSGRSTMLKQNLKSAAGDPGKLPVCTLPGPQIDVEEYNPPQTPTSTTFLVGKSPGAGEFSVWREDLGLLTTAPVAYQKSVALVDRFRDGSVKEPGRTYVYTFVSSTFSGACGATSVKVFGVRPELPRLTATLTAPGTVHLEAACVNQCLNGYHQIRIEGPGLPAAGVTGRVGSLPGAYAQLREVQARAVGLPPGIHSYFATGIWTGPATTLLGSASRIDVTVP